MLGPCAVSGVDISLLTEPADNREPSTGSNASWEKSEDSAGPRPFQRVFLLNLPPSTNIHASLIRNFNLSPQQPKYPAITSSTYKELLRHYVAISVTKKAMKDCVAYV